MYSRAMAGVLVVGALSGRAHADRTLTLDDALQLARTNNRDLRAARTRLVEAHAGIELARAALMPTAGAKAAYTHNYKEVDFDFSSLIDPTLQLSQILHDTGTPAQAAAVEAFQTGVHDAFAGIPNVVIQKQEQLDASAGITVPLVAPAGWYGYSAAKRASEAATAGYSVNEAAVLLGVAQAYFAAAGTDELITARQDAVKVATETFDVAKARVAAELANQVDITRAETALIRANQDLAEAENARGAAYRGLATLIGTKETFTLATAKDATFADAAAVDQLVSGAKTKRPELTAEKATIEAANASEKADLWRWSPTLSAFARGSLQNYAGFSGDKYYWAVGVQLDWTLYDGGVRDAQRHQTEAQRDAATARLELLGDTVSDEVTNAHGTFDTKRKGVAASQRAVELARETLRLVRAQYDAGSARQLDVLTAQDELVRAEVTLAQAHFDVSLADLQLRRASGDFPAKR